MVVETLGQAVGKPRVVVGQALARQGVFAELLGQFAQARKLLQDSLAILRHSPLDTGREVAFVLTELGIVLLREGDQAEAKQHLLESLARYRALKDTYGIAWTLNALGNVANDLTGQYAEAMQFYEESLALRREIGDRRGLATSLNNLGTVANNLGDYTGAKQFLQESIAVYQEVDYRIGLALALNNLGYTAQLRGEYREARRLYQESLVIRQEVGDRFAIALVLNNLGLMAIHLGEYAEAKHLLHESLTMHQEIGDRGGIAEALNFSGLLADQTQDSQSARDYFRKGLQVATDNRLIPHALDILVGMAGSLVKEGETAQERAAELLAFALHHPATLKETKDRAARLLAELESQLPPQVMVAAQERGKARKLEEVVEALLGESEVGEVE